RERRELAERVGAGDLVVAERRSVGSAQQDERADRFARVQQRNDDERAVRARVGEPRELRARVLREVADELRLASIDRTLGDGTAVWRLRVQLGAALARHCDDL